MPAWVRGALLLIGLGLGSVFGVAWCLEPYDAAGRPLRMQTHTQLGLPPCTFKQVSGWPCPSCGLTTSFALLVRGDWRASLAANAVGTLTALAGLVAAPWALLCASRGRLYFVRSPERLLTRLVVALVVLLVVRWCLVLGLAGSQGAPGPSPDPGTEVDRWQRRDCGGSA
jgi:hypothetical protein